MAECYLSSAIQFCDYSMGGIKTLFLGNLSDVASFDIDRRDDTITGITFNPGKVMYWFTSVGDWVEASETKSDTNNGYLVEQTMDFNITNMSNVNRARIHELCHTSSFAIIINRLGKKFLYGETAGLTLDSSNAQTGRRSGDFNGYQVTLIGRERNYAREINMTDDELFALSTPTPTPPGPVDCTAYSALTWGATSVSPAYFGDLASCLYSDFL